MTKLMKKIKKVKRDLDKLQDSIDLKKAWPGYFNKWVFRLSIVAMVALLVFTAYTNGWSLRFEYVMCPEGTEQCIYEHKGAGFLDSNYTIMEPGQVIGDQPNKHALNFNRRAWIFAGLAFLVNHIVYAIKHKTLIYRRELHDT